MENQAGEEEKEPDYELSRELLQQKSPRCYKYLIFWRIPANSKDAELLESYSRLYGGRDVGVKLLRTIMNDRDAVFKAHAHKEMEREKVKAKYEEMTRELHGI